MSALPVELIEPGDRLLSIQLELGLNPTHVNQPRSTLHVGCLRGGYFVVRSPSQKKQWMEKPPCI